ncbi:MAG: TadE family protein [Planctomycetaceae bacterium]
MGTRQTITAQSRWSRKRRGVAAVEMAIVLPFFMLLLTGFMQFAWIFLVRHSMLHAAREATRAYSVQDATAAQAMQRAQNVLQTFGYTVSEFTVSSNLAGNDVSVTISIPMSSPQVAIVDPFNLVGSGTLTAVATMRTEDSL